MRIDNEFKNLIPPLQPDEYRQLEENILNEGIRESIITWQGIIIDGHNRFEIAEKHNLIFNTIEKEFADREAVILWIIDNQSGRRNLSDYSKYELSKVKAEILRERGKKKLSESGKKGNDIRWSGLSNIDKGNNHNTQKEIADFLGWSTGKTAMADIVDKKAPEEIKQKLRTKEITINQAYKDIKKEEKEKKKTEKAEELKSQNFEPDINIHLGDCLNYINTLQDKSIDCLLTDPPYGENFQMNKYDNELSRKIENDESLEDALILLDDMLSRVKPKLKDNAHLYIFCSWKNFAEFKEVVSNHFKVKNALIWNKELFGMGDLKGNYADTYEMIIFAGGNREFVKRPGNIITCRFNEERFHNTQKPVDLLSELIENSTDAGDLIFDPFLGSGSTAVASKKLNRNYSGCELDEQNYKITLKRLADE